jgi:hypothetical protein
LRPILEPVVKNLKVMVGTSVRKPVAVLEAHLDSLRSQILPPNTELTCCYVTDWPVPPTDGALKALNEFATHRGTILKSMEGQLSDDFKDSGVNTHNWGVSAIQRVANNKNRIIEYFLKSDADYLWFCDADLMLDQMTLWSMLSCEKPVVCAVYWTKWHRNAGERDIPAMPQVWLRHPYDMTGHGYEDPGEFRQKLVKRELTQVWGQGACTLIKKDVLETGVNFNHQPELENKGGMSIGEDRHFCFQLEKKHITMWADPWPDIFHLYHLPEGLERVDGLRDRLVRRVPSSGLLGDMVSITLEAVEPLMQGNEAFFPAKQYIRGRISELKLQPELEEAIYGMRRGQAKLVEVHFPSHYAFLPYRNSRRLIRLALIDRKPYGFAPVLEDELWVGPKSGKFVDVPSLNPTAQSVFQEAHNGFPVEPTPEGRREGTPDDSDPAPAAVGGEQGDAEGSEVLAEEVQRDASEGV